MPRIFGIKFGNSPEGSAFSKVAQAAEKVTDAKGRIIAIDAANREKHEEASELEGEVSRVHGETDNVHKRLDSVLDKL